MEIEANENGYTNNVSDSSENSSFSRLDADDSYTSAIQSPPYKRHCTDYNDHYDVKAMVATVLLDCIPLLPIDSTEIFRKLNNGYCTPADKNALTKLGGEHGAIGALENVLKALAEENSLIEIEKFTLCGKSSVMVLDVGQTLLANYYRDGNSSNRIDGVPQAMGLNNLDPCMVSNVSQYISTMPQTGPLMFSEGYNPFMMGQNVGYGGYSPYSVPPCFERPPVYLNPSVVPYPQAKPRTHDDDGMKEIESLLKKKSFKEIQKSKAEEELYQLINRPTAKQIAMTAKFKSKGNGHIKEYCNYLTKDDCRRQRYSMIACEKFHFRRVIAAHTDISLGDCTFLDNCRRPHNCKYVHYELDQFPGTGPMMGMSADNPPPGPLFEDNCSELQLGEPQWINCDIRTLKMDTLGKFGVIMADPPWNIRMDLPYGTMTDDEVKNLNVPALQTDGLIFLWVTGRAMELARECLEIWGYRRVEEIIWVKVNQLQRTIITGRTGHWLNHSKEHCLIGIKGDPKINCKIDTDIIVSEIREVSRKPEEIYSMIERICPDSRKIELFARKHNVHAGWLSIGNQLDGVRLVDEELRERFKAEYPDVEMQPILSCNCKNS